MNPMSFKLSVEEVADILNEIIRSEEFGSSGKNPLDNTREQTLTRRISEIFNENPTYSMNYDLYLHHQCKNCDLVLTDKKEKKALKANEDELWLEVKLYFEKRNEYKTEEKTEDINKLLFFNRATKGFCLIVLCENSSLPDDDVLTNAIDRINEKTSSKPSQRYIPLNTNINSCCFLLLWFF